MSLFGIGKRPPPPPRPPEAPGRVRSPATMTAGAAGGSTKPPAEPAAAPADPARTPSRVVQHLLESAARRSAEGRPPRVLLAGPVAQVTMESIAGAGCRLTVEGEFFPELPLAYPDARFDLVLGLDVLDLLPDDRAREQAAEWARVLAPGGTLYLVARRAADQVPPLVRIDVHPDGGLSVHPLGPRHPLVQPRQNREFEVLVRPLAVHEISLRRDGLREILCRK